MILGIYVDDGILIGNDEQQIETVLNKLEKDLEIKVDKQLSMFLGMEIQKKGEAVYLKQGLYIKKMLKEFRMDESNPTNTPILYMNENGENLKLSEYNRSFPYQKAVGSLLYLANKTRPDIGFAVNYESRMILNTSDQDTSNVRRSFKYLKKTASDGLKFDRNCQFDVLEAYTDADYAGDIRTRKSTSGFVIFYGNGPISWCSRLQPIVALSSTEAEYIAAADCLKELLYLKALLEELLERNIKINLYIDNMSALKMIKSGVVNRRSKHIDVRYHFMHEKFREGVFQLKHCPSREQLADIFTKPLGAQKFWELRNGILKP